ncbi:MAG TPA: prepilin-type N-terminal cleavage/methylation domain-containing protein [Candidatus Paceibacterota bacterium]|nr:prepilin-type N-terminal cleavage/methylation domain-containing protein [Candidatus Paceibacterota bacterium]
MTHRAFTLIETLVVVAVVAIVGLALHAIILRFYQANTYVLQGTAAVNSARNGVTTLSSNIREVTYSDDGAYPLSQAATSSVTFYADVDKDGGVERVRMYLIEGTFYRVVTNAAGSPPTYMGQAPATTTIATYVANGTSTPLFRYFNASGTELTGSVDTTEVASILTTLMVDINPHRAPDIYTLTQSATLRNLRNE